MSLKWERTQFPDNAIRTFIIYPDSVANRHTDIDRKFGGGTGFAFSNWPNAMRAAEPGDSILFCSGDYAPTAALTVNKAGLRIGSLSGNPHDVRFDATATADIEVFTFAATADYCTLENMTISGDDSATPSSAVTSAGVGNQFKNLYFIGADIDVAVAAIDINAARNDILNCKFFDYRDAIDLGAAASCVVKGNYIHTDNDAAIGIDLSGVASWSLIDSNILHLTGGTGDTGIKVANGALLVSITNNIIHADCADAISAGSGGTMIGVNYTTGSVAVDFTVTNGTAIQTVVFD